MRIDLRTCFRASTQIFPFDPIFYVLFLFAAVLGTILTSDLGGISNERKNSNKLSNSKIL